MQAGRNRSILILLLSLSAEKISLTSAVIGSIEHAPTVIEKGENRMIKKFKNSRIEIWGRLYINDHSIRDPEDKDAVILQIEPSGVDSWIVEITDHEPEEIGS